MSPGTHKVLKESHQFKLNGRKKLGATLYYRLIWQHVTALTELWHLTMSSPGCDYCALLIVCLRFNYCIWVKLLLVLINEYCYIVRWLVLCASYLLTLPLALVCGIKEYANNFWYIYFFSFETKGGNNKSFTSAQNSEVVQHSTPQHSTTWNCSQVVKKSRVNWTNKQTREQAQKVNI